jgi:ferredoxin
MIRVHTPHWQGEGTFPPGATIHEAVRALGHVIDFACGGNALCGTCCVQVEDGAELLAPAGAEETGRLADIDRTPPFFRLACQARLADGAAGAVAIRVEPEQ